MVRTFKSHFHCLFVCDVVDICEIFAFLGQNIKSSVKNALSIVLFEQVGKSTINNVSKQVVMKKLKEFLLLFVGAA